MSELLIPEIRHKPTLVTNINLSSEFLETVRSCDRAGLIMASELEDLLEMFAEAEIEFYQAWVGKIPSPTEAKSKLAKLLLKLVDIGNRMGADIPDMPEIFKESE